MTRRNRKRGLFDRTSGASIPLTVTLAGDTFQLRDYVITLSLEAMSRSLTGQETDRIMEVTTLLRREYPECWKTGTHGDPCPGIVRACTTLMSLITRPGVRTRDKEIKDLKRWMEYGRKL